MQIEKRPIVFIAGPITHADKQLEQWRRDQYPRFAAWLVQHEPEVVPYCAPAHNPLIYSHLPEDAKLPYLQTQALGVIPYSSAVYVLALDGWAHSVGLGWELQVAQQYHIPVVFYGGSDGAFARLHSQPEIPKTMLNPVA